MVHNLAGEVHGKWFDHQTMSHDLTKWDIIDYLESYIAKMTPATLDDTISVLDFFVVYKSSSRKTILLMSLVLTVVSPIYKIFKSLCRYQLQVTFSPSCKTWAYIQLNYTPNIISEKGEVSEKSTKSVALETGPNRLLVILEITSYLFELQYLP